MRTVVTLWSLFFSPGHARHFFKIPQKIIFFQEGMPDEYKMSVFPKIISLKSPLIVIPYKVSHIACSLLITLKIKIKMFGRDAFAKKTSFVLVWEACGDHQKNCQKRSQGEKQRFSNSFCGIISILNILHFIVYDFLKTHLKRTMIRNYVTKMIHTHF